MSPYRICRAKIFRPYENGVLSYHGYAPKKGVLHPKIFNFSQRMKGLATASPCFTETRKDPKGIERVTILLLFHFFPPLLIGLSQSQDMGLDIPFVEPVIVIISLGQLLLGSGNECAILDNRVALSLICDACFQ